MRALGTGTTFQEISTINMANCKIPLPPFSEQQRIADYLDAKCEAIDAAIAKQEQLVAKLGEYRKSVIHAAVTGRIDLSQGA